LELLSYGHARGSKELREIIESDGYKQYASPFAELPSNVLEDLNSAVYSRRSGMKYLLHMTIHPQLTCYTVLLHGSLHVAMDLLSKRCASGLRSLTMTYSVNVPPMYYASFFSSFDKLVSLNLFASMVDDYAFRYLRKNNRHVKQ